MNVKSLAAVLQAHPGKLPRFILPGANAIPGHFHVTEVGHVTKNFIDCGGTVRKTESCVLQTWIHDDDLDHRLTTERLGVILALGAKVLPNDELEVEVEYEGTAISQFPLEEARVSDQYLDLILTTKHTDCLAREKCGIGEESCCGEPAEAGCC